MILTNLFPARTVSLSHYSADEQAEGRTYLSSPGSARLRRYVDISREDLSDSFESLTAYNRHSMIDEPEIFDLTDVMAGTAARCMNRSLFDL